MAQALPDGWAQLPPLDECLMSWAESFEFFETLGSPGWWERAAASYPAHAVLTAFAREAELLATLEDIPQGGRVLDLACGPGVTTRLLITAGAGEAIGMDVSAAMIDLARSGPGRDGVSFRKGDVRTGLPFPADSFDAAVLGDFYDSGTIEEMLRVVRPGGLVSVRMTDVIPGRFYGCETDLDRRVHDAYVAGERARSGSSRAAGTSWVGQALADGLTHVSTVAVERVGELEPLGGGFLLASDVWWRLGNAASQLSPEDMARVRELWNPGRPDALLHRGDNHVLQNMTLATATGR